MCALQVGLTRPWRGFCSLIGCFLRARGAGWTITVLPISPHPIWLDKPPPKSGQLVQQNRLLGSALLLHVDSLDHCGSCLLFCLHGHRSAGLSPMPRLRALPLGVERQKAAPAAMLGQKSKQAPTAPNALQLGTCFAVAFIPWFFGGVVFNFPFHSSTSIFSLVFLSASATIRA